MGHGISIRLQIFSLSYFEEVLLPTIFYPSSFVFTREVSCLFEFHSKARNGHALAFNLETSNQAVKAVRTRFLTEQLSSLKTFPCSLTCKSHSKDNSKRANASTQEVDLRPLCTALHA
jgi:hypothetical protein